MDELEKSEESLLEQQVAPDKPKKSVRSRIFFIIIMLLGLGGLLANNYYSWILGRENAIREAAQADAARASLLAQQKTDTYGGKTPYETLALYTEAVKKGDYVLASKYFVIEKQQQEFDGLTGADKTKFKKYIDQLTQAIATVGGYDLDKTEFTITRPVLVDFLLYPSGVWKINEI